MTDKEQERFEELLNKDGTSEGDRERRSLFWILANNSDLYSKVKYIYDFEDRCIKLECIEGVTVDLCSSSRALIRLSFNLFNGYNGERTDRSNILAPLDCDNYNTAIQAINIRFNR